MCAHDDDSRRQAREAIQAEITGHWPHAARRAIRGLDLDSTEQHALRILARGLRTQRLTAFVGSGTSAAFGRPTWAGLLNHLYDTIEGAVAGQTSSDKAIMDWWQAIKAELWADKGSAAASPLEVEAKTKANFQAFRDAPIKSQVLSIAARIMEMRDPPRGTDHPDHIQAEAAKLLAGPDQYIRQIVKALCGEDPPIKPPEGEPHPDRTLGLRGVVEVLVPAIERQLAAGCPTPEHGAALAEALGMALQYQTLDDDNPIKALAHYWGIKRFITTNYDAEIQHGLERLGYLAKEAPQRSSQANLYEEILQAREDTGRVVRFAIEGPRRHASVLHIHGLHTQPQSLIINEEQYQRLYLDEHPTWDLVANATAANFAANPILFVGTGLTEDDILRPLRQFMSGDGHRHDRMAVALMPARDGERERRGVQASQLLKHGIHIIYFGWEECQHSRSTAKPAAKEPWLHTFLAKCSKLNQYLAGDALLNCPGDYDELALSVRQLTAPQLMEGIDPDSHHGLNLTADLSALARIVPATLSGLDDKQQRQYQAAVIRVGLQLMLDRVSTAFCCAKLIRLQQRANDIVLEDATLPIALRLPGISFWRNEYKSQQGVELLVHRRHGVVLNHADFGGRFSSIPTRPAPPDDDGEPQFCEGIEILCKDIEAHLQGAEVPNRRLILVCGARGHGKGGQFDRLLATQGAADVPGSRPYLDQLLQALGRYGSARQPHRLLHINLSFSNELGPAIEQLGAVLHEMRDKDHRPLRKYPRNDTIEQLDRGLSEMDKSPGAGRLLLILGNAGVLFDQSGLPKNGLIHRVSRLMFAKCFEAAPIDILAYVGESQVPLPLRTRPADATAGSAHPQVMDLEDHEVALSELDARAYPDGHRRPRRLHRLNIVRYQIPGLPGVLVHPLRRTRFSDLAEAYFPNVAPRVNQLSSVKARASDRRPAGADPDEHADSFDTTLAKQLYQATGGSRFAMTIILALLDTQPDNGDRQLESLLTDLQVALSGPPNSSTIETVIDFAMDRWAARHLLPDPLPPHARPAAPAEPLSPLTHQVWQEMQALGNRPTPQAWHLATEMIWHLGAFAHPVEPEVLMGCPRVVLALEKLPCARQGPQAHWCTVVAMLELLVHWCLLFRIGQRPLIGAIEKEVAGRGQRYRYAPHRHMQRHVLRLMGGRNVESTQWDQFTITLYGSLPDEAPALKPGAHKTLTEVLRSLTGCPSPERLFVSEPQGLPQVPRWLTQSDRIRAAYYLVRSTYSLGVVAHLSPDSADHDAGCGHMEEYRRLVRWITHAARYWEREHGPALKDVLSQTKGWPEDPERRRDMGVFFASELVWLYNECGVISLAQGKLHDAEQLLTLAERAARRIEGDDSGTLHTRIRIHTALAQMERGRPHRAKLLLAPIADRHGGHPIPPLLAKYYLGQIEHIGGNYEAAKRLYLAALGPLREYRRSRAAAFILISLADVEMALRPDKSDEALSTANEAISLAQQGGHEDVRYLAMVGRARILIDRQGRASNAPTTVPAVDSGTAIFEQLKAAELYAARMEIPRLTAEVQELRARLLLMQGEYQMSARQVTSSLEISALYDMKLKKARGLLTLAHIYCKRGDRAGARDLCRMGTEIAVSCDYYTCVRGFKELELELDRA